MNKIVEKVVIYILTIVTLFTSLSLGIGEVIAIEKDEFDEQYNELLSEENIELINLDYTEDEIVVESKNGQSISEYKVRQYGESVLDFLIAITYGYELEHNSEMFDVKKSLDDPYFVHYLKTLELWGFINNK